MVVPTVLLPAIQMSKWAWSYRPKQERCWIRSQIKVRNGRKIWNYNQVPTLFYLSYYVNCFIIARMINRKLHKGLRKIYRFFEAYLQGKPLRK